MAERASGHRARGWARRSAVSAIQAISPWRPAATNSARRAPAGHGPVTEAKRQTSKPRFSALSRTSSRSASEIEVVIVAGRLQAGPAIGQDGTEGGPGLQLHVPGLDVVEAAPRHVPEVVDHRELRRGGEVGQ